MLRPAGEQWPTSFEMDDKSIYILGTADGGETYCKGSILSRAPRQAGASAQMFKFSECASAATSDEKALDWTTYKTGETTYWLMKRAK